MQEGGVSRRWTEREPFTRLILSDTAAWAIHEQALAVGLFARRAEELAFQRAVTGDHRGAREVRALPERLPRQTSIVHHAATKRSVRL